MDWDVFKATIAIGSFMIIVSSYYLFHYYGKIVGGQDTTVSVSALKEASNICKSGIIILILGILYAMDVIPF